MRRRGWDWLCGCLLFATCLAVGGAFTAIVRTQPAMFASALLLDVHFSPHGGCTEEVVSQIGKAKRTIDVQSYSFTSKPIADALVAAVKRGVKVRWCMDKSTPTERNSSLPELRKGGVECWVDRKHAIAHSKVMVYDSRTVTLGSFNFTDQAEAHNLENLLTVHDAALAKRYEANWEEHRQHCEPAR